MIDYTPKYKHVEQAIITAMRRNGDTTLQSLMAQANEITRRQAYASEGVYQYYRNFIINLDRLYAVKMETK